MQSKMIVYMIEVMTAINTKFDVIWRRKALFVKFKLIFK